MLGKLHKTVIVVIFLLFASRCAHATSVSATRIRTDTTDFNNNLSSGDTTAQKALDTLDDLSIIESDTLNSVCGRGNSTDQSIACGGSTAGQSLIASGLVVNDDGGATASDDFRVETDTESNAFVVDADGEDVEVNVDFNIKTGKNITLGTTQWNSSDEIDGTKIKDADYGDITVSAAGVWSIDSNTGSFSKSFIITNPTASADGAVWRVPAACTITAVHGIIAGGTNLVGHLTECDANGLNPAGVDGATDMTITTTNTNDDGDLSNPSIDSGDYIGWRTTSVSGTVTKLIVTFEGTYD